MAKNLTNIHGKLDKILSRLSALDTRQISDTQRTNNQIRLMTQLLGEVARMARETSQMARETSLMARETSQAVRRLGEIQEDVAFMANEARKEAREAKERVIELSARSQRH
ncbi:MAG: hypothetical protein HYZ50_03720 [Deltaproteobacteria bacterium]|nr:hypothetical protein [Deltaproteobacteria bacterium]